MMFVSMMLSVMVVVVIRCGLFCSVVIVLLVLVSLEKDDGRYRKVVMLYSMVEMVVEM